MSGTFYTLVMMDADYEPYFDFGHGRKVHSYETRSAAQAFNTRHLSGKAGILETTVPNVVTCSDTEFKQGARSKWAVNE